MKIFNGNRLIGPDPFNDKKGGGSWALVIKRKEGGGPDHFELNKRWGKKRAGPV